MTTLQELASDARKVQDKRTALFAEPEIESERLRKRAEIKLQLAELQLTERRIAELSAEIDASDRRREAAADHHSEICTPIQSTLKVLEEAEMSALTNRQPVPDAIKTERAELLRQLSDANETLEREVTVQKQLVAPLKKEREKLREEMGWQTVLQNKLVSPGIGRPDLLDALHLAKQDSNWLVKRLSVAQEHVALNRARIEQDPRNAATYAERLHLWEIEVAHVQKLAAVANRESERLRTEAINE